MGRDVYSDRLTRGGPLMRSPGFRNFFAEIETDERKAVSVGLEGDYQFDTRVGGRPPGSSSVDVQAVDDAQHQRRPRADAPARHGAVRPDRHRPGRHGDLRRPLRLRRADADRVVAADAREPDPEPADVVPGLRAAAALGRPVRQHQGSREATHLRLPPLRRSTPGRSRTTRAATATRSIRRTAATAARSCSTTRTSTSSRCGSTPCSAGSSGRARRPTSCGRSSGRTRRGPGRLAFGPDLTSMFGAPSDNVLMLKVSYWFSR